MDNVFFRKAMPEEHIMVLTYEKRLTKLELLILFFAVISFIMDLAVLIDFLFLGNTFWTNLPNSRTGRGEYTRFCILLSGLVLDPFFIILIAAKISRLKKIKNGDYVVQRAMAVNKNNDSVSLWKRTVKVTFMSDGGMLYVTDISEIVAKEMPLDKPGLLIRVNRNRPPVIYDECRFIYI